MSDGRTVRLFLIDGTPTGLMTAEIMNWTGHVLRGSRARLADVLQRPEASRTGIYILTGEDPMQPERTRVYIGEGDNVIDRIKSHAKDPSKDFWTHVCIITSKDANITKAHGRYLESRMVELAKAAGRATLANGNEPNPKLLPESDVADMEFFLSQLQIILPVVGFDFLREQPSSTSKSIPLSPPPPATRSAPLLSLRSKRYNVVASAMELDGEFFVLAGSEASTKSDSSTNQYRSVRQLLIESDTLKRGADPEKFIFAQDVSFRSPSEAASIILNRNSNGRTEWRIYDTGQTLKDWQDSQIENLQQR